MKKKQDLRVIKTRECLHNALFELVEEKSFYDIKIKEICERARVNRATFYDHFEDKYDLYHSKFEEVINLLTIKLNNLGSLRSKDEFVKSCRILIAEAINYSFSAESHLKKSLKIKENSVMFEKEIRSYARYFITKWLKKETVDLGVPKNILSEFYAGAFSSVILWWIREDNKISKEKLCDYIVKAMNL